MKTRKLVTWVIPILVFILLMPFHEKFSMENEARASKQKPKVLLFIRKGTPHRIELMLKEEVGVMTSMLEEADFEVIVATASGEPIKAQTTKLIPDLKLADVKVNDYLGIIMPCMAKGAVPSWHASPEEISLVKEAVAQGKPIAAQQGAIIILAEAGVLVSKKYTYYFDPERGNNSFVGAIYSGVGVIQDGNIITSSNCPYLAFGDGTSELTKLFIETIKD